MLFQVTKEAISSNQKPWLDRFMKLANALYNSDISNKGKVKTAYLLEYPKFTCHSKYL